MISKRFWIFGYVNTQISISNYPLNCVFLLDETNVAFDCEPSQTLAGKGEKKITIKTLGTSDRCTVILESEMDGTKFPPLLVFKEKTGGRFSREFTGLNSEFPTGCRYTVQENELVDRVVFLRWI